MNGVLKTITREDFGGYHYTMYLFVGSNPLYGQSYCNDGRMLVLQCLGILDESRVSDSTDTFSQ